MLKYKGTIIFIGAVVFILSLVMFFFDFDLDIEDVKCILMSLIGISTILVGYLI
jgi:hypothetical protein